MTSDIRFGTDGWRAVIGDDFTMANVRRTAAAAGRAIAADHPGGLVYVGHDTRFEAGTFAAAAAEVLAGCGLEVRLTGRYCPTPCLCWTVAHDDDAVGGVMLTASHNPAAWLGVKLRMPDGGASPKAFTDRVEALVEPGEPAERGGFETVDIVGPYLDSLRGLVDGPSIAHVTPSVAVDPLYGAGRGYLAATLRALGADATEVHGEDNPGFGGLHPEPIPPHVDEVSALVRAQGLAAGFVTDGDADRIGAVDENGAFVDPHRIICLVTRHLVEDRGMTGKVVKTLSTSVLVDRLAAHLGLEVVTTPVGFKWIYEQMVAGGVLIGGEESGGIGLPHHVRERDGLLMALLLVEMIAKSGKGLGGLIEDLYAITGPMSYRRVDVRLAPEAAAAFVARMLSLAPAELAGLPVREVVRTDGVKFLLPDDAWLLMRASGTEPLVRVYAEASSAGVVDDLLAAGRGLLEGGEQVAAGG